MSINGNGWAGTILYVDLTLEKINKVPLDPNMARDYIGGDGFGTRLLWDILPPGTPPLDPANPYIISTSPLTGSVCPSSGRLSVAFKSPMTGLIGLSNAGGFFAPELKQAGYDAVVITGRANRPVWLWINDNKVEIRDAKHLWGKESWDTIEAIEKELDDHSVQTMVIGPAGENMVHYALPLVNRTRQLGKCGGGAVMGSKNLKAVVAKGTKGVRMHDSKTFEQLCFDLRQNILSSEMCENLSKHGTSLIYSVLEEVHGALPTRNFQEGLFPEGRESLSIEKLVEEHEIRPNSGCYACPIQCARIVDVKKGQYKGLKMEGLDYYMHYIYGPNLGVANWDFIIKCYERMLNLGLQVSAGHIMSWVAELYQRGLISKEKLDNIDLSWGNQEAFLQLLDKIAHRDGIGDILANNFIDAGIILGPGTEKYQPLITRLDTSECPRARYDVALTHLISNRGGDHHKALNYWTWIAPPEYTPKHHLPGFPLEGSDMHSPVGKPELTDYSEKCHAICDTLGVCIWSSFLIIPDGGGLPHEYAAILSAATGVEYDKDKLLECCERVLILERAFNVREGFDRSLYEMSEMWYETAVPAGPQKGVKADRVKIQGLVDEFLVRRGFDPKSGFPTRKKLEEMGLSKEADQLEKAGRIGKPEVVNTSEATPSKKNEKD